MNKQDQKRHDEFIRQMNVIANKILGPQRGFYIYSAGSIGRKSFKYTQSRVRWNGRLGFYSWVEIYYKTKKMGIRRKIAYSRTRKKAEARAIKLYEQEKAKQEAKNEHEISASV